MHRRVLAFDFDGTLVENEIVPQALQKGLEHLRTAGYSLLLVTGSDTKALRSGRSETFSNVNITSRAIDTDAAGERPAAVIAKGSVICITQFLSHWMARR